MAQLKEIFEYGQYKRYLQDWIEAQPKGGHGVRSAMAKALQCQVAYVSQILHGRADLSLEQADALNRFLNHSRDESLYFLLLVQHDRAGTAPLKRHFREQLEVQTQKRLVLKDRLGVSRVLDFNDQVLYYSAWQFAAAHVALSIPELQKREQLARRLGLSPAKLSQLLDFLVATGLAVQKDGKFIIGPSRIHVGEDSPLVARHHANWRQQAMRAMDSGSPSDLHYSSVVTMSAEDTLKLKSMLVKWITEAKAVIRDSKEEDVHCLNFDFFRLPS